MKKKELDFEEALKKLETLVQQLEQGDIPLEESIKAFEEGKNLIKFCMQLLDKAEGRINKLEESSADNFELKDF